MQIISELQGLNQSKDYHQFLTEKKLKTCTSFALCYNVKRTADSSHYTWWLPSHLNPLVTSTKHCSHCWSRISPAIVVITAGSARSDPLWWLESRLWHTIAAGPEVPFTSAQNVVLTALSLRWSHVEMPFGCKSLSITLLCLGLSARTDTDPRLLIPISCLRDSYSDLRLITMLHLSHFPYPRGFNGHVVRISLSG